MIEEQVLTKRVAPHSWSEIDTMTWQVKKDLFFHFSSERPWAIFTLQIPKRNITGLWYHLTWFSRWMGFSLVPHLGSHFVLANFIFPLSHLSIYKKEVSGVCIWFVWPVRTEQVNKPTKGFFLIQKPTGAHSIGYLIRQRPTDSRIFLHALVQRTAERIQPMRFTAVLNFL